MTLSQTVSLLACVGELSFALVAVSRGRRSPLGARLALVSFLAFTWNFAAFAYDVSRIELWHTLDDSLSPWTSPLVVDFILTFIGQRRRHRLFLVAGYSWLGALSLTTAFAGIGEASFTFAGSKAWGLWHLSGVIPLLGFSLILLFQHGRSAVDSDEKASARLLFIAIAVATALGLTELLEDVGWPVPGLSSLGILLGNALMLVVALRFKLLGQRLESTSTLVAVALAVGGALVYVIIFKSLGVQRGPLVIATVSVTLLVSVSLWEVASVRRMRSSHAEQLTTLGRFSQQMAHDLKNPLAALHGVLQYAQEELRQSRPFPDGLKTTDFMLDQVRRLHTTVDQYQRLGRIEPLRRKEDLNALIQREIGVLSVAARPGIQLEMNLARLPLSSFDPDLIGQALHNLVLNALEAMSAGGTLTLRTRALSDSLELSVTDSGEGMEAHVAERAFDGFVTTKPHGSGLGLVFVSRVAEAHGGEALLMSRRGKGTTVRITLPRDLRESLG